MSSYRLFADCRLPKGCPLSWVSVTYGPFTSRRRGPSLGINLFPVKSVCNFNCAYCFRGGAQIKSCKPTPGPYNIGPEIVKKALKKALKEVGKVKAIDLSGNGEPTLHPNVKEIVRDIVRLTKELKIDASLGLFTNSSMLNLKHVMEAVRVLDHVEAKLDTVLEWKFRIINRPCKNISLRNILFNLITLRKSFDGTLAIQTILLEYNKVKNYTIRDAELLAEELLKIDPDVVNVYTVYRRPRLSSVRPAPKRSIEEFSKVLRDHGLKVRTFYE